MKQIPNSFRQALSSGQAIEPFALVAIWHDPNALEDRLFTAARLEAKDDVASSQDSSVRLLDNKIALEKGVAVPMATATSSKQAFKQLWWELTVDEVGSWVWK